MPNLQSLNGVPVGLTTLKIEGCTIQDFDGLEGLSDIQTLVIKQDQLEISTNVFQGMTALTHLHLENVTFTVDDEVSALDLREVLYSEHITMTLWLPKSLLSDRCLPSINHLTLVGLKSL